MLTNHFTVHKINIFCKSTEFALKKDSGSLKCTKLPLSLMNHYSVLNWLSCLVKKSFLGSRNLS